MKEIRGIDISQHNKNLDYNALKKWGVEFAIIRTGYRQRTDDMFHVHMKGCLSAGIKVGAYTYCKATNIYEAKREAEYAKTLLDQYPNKIIYPVFYDMEDSSLINLGKDNLTEIAATFLAEIEGYGYKAGIYANPSWFENYLDKKRFMGFYEIWLAHWTQDPSLPTKYNYGQSIWQWGLDLSIGLDGDICYVDYGESKNPTTPEPPKSSKFKKGDVVKISDGAVYYDNGKPIPDWVIQKQWIILQCVGDRAVIDESTDGKNAICSPVNIKYLNLATPSEIVETNPTVREGDIVGIIQGAKTWYESDVPIPDWVFDKEWIVLQCKGDRAVIDKSVDGRNSICSPINSKYLEVCGHLDVYGK